MKKSALKAALAAVLLIGTALCSADDLGSLKSMERQRALLVQTLLSHQLKPQQRRQKIARIQSALMHMESMVIRDDRLLGSRDARVQRAFQNYDQTFLVHASAEKGKALSLYWFESIGLNTQTILDTRIGWR